MILNRFGSGFTIVPSGRIFMRLLNLSTMSWKTIVVIISKEGGKMNPIVEMVEEYRGKRIVHMKVGNKLYAYVIEFEWAWKRFWNYYRRGAMFKALLVLKNHGRLIQKGGQYVG